MKSLRFQWCVCLLLLLSCGVKEQDIDSPTPSEISFSSIENDDAVNKEPNLSEQSASPFTAFYLTAVFENGKKYSVMYDHMHKNEAIIHDQRKDTKLIGEDAVDQLLPLFITTGITHTMEKDEALHQIMNVFLIRQASMVSLDIYFADGEHTTYLYQEND
ncbi:YusW family protein [Aureibacillus halotolerans]|uniref:YusW-like protein n=1 Tax=Aureibacillus halotolerans TaxID=1508390 RepID=A0A4R6U867_9BACI|nr:YusW family protein [Aureibacillus halotolerans]TDQ41996.1 YusW-like protein [Aureibacillus halotolerans]